MNKPNKPKNTGKVKRETIKTAWPKELKNPEKPNEMCGWCGKKFKYHRKPCNPMIGSIGATDDHNSKPKKNNKGRVRR